MRDRLADRWRPRTVGAVDARIANMVRRQGDSNIPRAIGTPLVWACADDQVMALMSLPNQGTFTDRIGVSWATTSGADPIRQAPSSFNGRHAWLTGDDDAGSTLNCIFESTAVTTAANVTVFAVARNLSHPSGGCIPLQKGTVDVEWGFSWVNPNLRFYYNATIVSSGAAGTGSLFVMTGRGTAAAVELFINGTLSAGPTAPGAANTSISSKVFMGGNGPSPGNNYTNCMIAEVIVYDSALSDANRAAVEAYLIRKYAIGG